jgi:hypothetical protein
MQQDTQELCTEDKMHDLEEEQIIILPCPLDYLSQQDNSTRNVLIEKLIKKARLAKSDCKITSIPTNFLTLLDGKIINANNKSKNELKSNNKLWVTFGRDMIRMNLINLSAIRFMTGLIRIKKIR